MSYNASCICGNSYPSFPGFPCFPVAPSTPQWPNNGGCSCCDECDTFNDDGGNDHYSDHPTRPCCVNGNCSACSSIAGDAPWLMPKAIGCGRTHKCKFEWKFALYESELDDGDLPGRPPHTIVCVRATGTTKARIAKEKMIGNTTSGDDHDDPCQSYDLWLCLTIPVEIIIRDCCGFLYCLKSSFAQYVLIPLCTKVRNIKDAQVYVKVRVRLCSTVKVLGSGDDDDTIDGAPTAAPDTDPEEGDTPMSDDESCSNLGYEDGIFGDHALPTVKLDVLIEACIMRLVPYGVLGGDPYKCLPGAVPSYFAQ
ncbi:MAG: hypothetical protein LBS72_06465 [Oscillospiraceae bacterium]|jgi:hypothetical protein|nr:hypothetical protein [Oscillospiraceae bacterium]